MEVYFLKKLIFHRSEIRGRNESQKIEECLEAKLQTAFTHFAQALFLQPQLNPSPIPPPFWAQFKSELRPKLGQHGPKRTKTFPFFLHFFLPTCLANLHHQQLVSLTTCFWLLLHFVACFSFSCELPDFCFSHTNAFSLSEPTCLVSFAHTQAPAHAARHPPPVTAPVADNPCCCCCCHCPCWSCNSSYCPCLHLLSIKWSSPPIWL